MKMKKLISAVLTLCILSGVLPVLSSAAAAQEISPSSWAAVDGLGRTLSLNKETGNKRDDRFVGMFYWIWHYPWINDHAPVTTGSVLDKYPEAVNDWEHPAWNGTYSGRPYFWDEPLYGFYTNTDEYVLRKHAELLADADIDTVIFDATNQDIVFPEGYEALLRVWSKARNEGVNTPQITFMLNFSDKTMIKNQLYKIYDDIYAAGRYEDLWFRWDGKPLVMADIKALDLTVAKDREIYNFFTFRKNESTYFTDDFSKIKEVWGWCSDYPQAKFGKDIFGNVEQICVSVAQNANEYGLTAMNSPVGTVQGRSFTDGYFSYTYTYGGKEITVDKNTENALLYGLNFQQQWNYALEADPEFIFITGFNEWIAGRFDEWNGTENAFPDQFSPEYSRDIEPSKGILKDHYYYQLVENVRRFKGTNSLPATEAEKTININGDLSQWDSVYPEYNHYKGNEDRDSSGWQGYYYKNDSFRNDIVKAKIAYDSKNIYFYVETADKLTSSDDSSWMRLLIDTDTEGTETNWEGFEYLINRNSPKDGKATLEKCLGGLEFSEICKVDISIYDNVLQIEVPRTALGLTGDEVKFNFKWSDNHQGEDAMDFYINGDAAPGGRFAFVFDSEAKGSDSTISEKDYSFFKSICDAFIRTITEIRKFLNYLFR
ncbi:MAG: hypothetical protein E7573_04000 [Ruminococcaceae bacterium]|nr:hypothetical protein [Oscillospiraceae bacterium]MBR3596967.1 hypothetical protein [Clostridia bacterium]